MKGNNSVTFESPSMTIRRDKTGAYSTGTKDQGGKERRGRYDPRDGGAYEDYETTENREFCEAAHCKCDQFNKRSCSCRQLPTGSGCFRDEHVHSRTTFHAKNCNHTTSCNCFQQPSRCDRMHFTHPGGAPPGAILNPTSHMYHSYIPSPAPPPPPPSTHTHSHTTSYYPYQPPPQPILTQTVVTQQTQMQMGGGYYGGGYAGGGYGVAGYGRSTATAGGAVVKSIGGVPVVLPIDGPHR